MKVLVLGAGGFLGRAIIEHFVALQWQVCGLSRNASPFISSLPVTWQRMELPDPGFIDLLDAERPDLLIHAAGTANVGQSLREPNHDFQQSVSVWMHVLDSLRRSRAQSRVILLSSAAVYGNPKKLPIYEEDLPAPISPYGYHKHMCEEIAQYFVALYGMSICSVRIFSAYGNGLRRQVLWDICQKALSSQVIELMGTGDESRDFIHAKDIARTLAYIAEYGNFHAGLYNVASGVSTTIQQVASLLVQALGTENLIHFTCQQRSGDPRYWQADITKLNALGFVPEVSLQEGLYTYARWVQGGMM